MSTSKIRSKSVSPRKSKSKEQQVDCFLSNIKEDLNVSGFKYVNSREECFSNVPNYRPRTEDPSVRCDSNVSRMMRHGKEIVCLITLLLTTFAAIQNKPLKLGRSLQSRSFFSKGSFVQDWPAGQLELLQAQVSLSELALVFFYAPWCSESDFAKNVYERIAHIFHNEIYFAAVNCWQPGGECRAQYPKVQTWPVLMAYYHGGVAVQYTGPWNALSLAKFIENLMSPVKRIRCGKSLLKTRGENDAVIVGFFGNIRDKMFLLYRKASLKWLEQDPFQDLKFGVITGQTMKEFNVTNNAIKLYLWNETMVYPGTKWRVSSIIEWVKKVADFNVRWINLTGKKSSVLTSHLKKSPSVLLFTARDYVLNSNPDYFLVKQIAWEYSTCENGSLKDHLQYNFVLQGTENLRRLKTLKLECESRTSTLEDISNYKCPHPEINNITRNIPAVLKYGRPPKNHSFAKSSYEKSSNSSTISMINQKADIQSAKRLLQISRERLCNKIKLLPKAIFNSHINDLGMPSFMGSGCKHNKSLKFLILDSQLYNDISKRLTTDYGLTNLSEREIFIVDNASEATFKMDVPLSPSSLRTFVNNFHDGNLKRLLRRKEIKSKLETSTRSSVKMIEVDFDTLKNILEHSNSTLVILFYSSQCALCSLISQSLLRISNILKPLDITYLRIDGAENDFPWEYAMESYPILIIVPRYKRMESRIFPQNIEVSDKNILGFILANLPLTERLYALTEYCNTIKVNAACQSCISVITREILRTIEAYLKLWRQDRVSRNLIIKKLEILQQAFTILFRINYTCDMSNLRKLVINLRSI